MGEFKPITTQEELNEVLKDRLNRQKESIESKYANYDELVEENKSLKEQLSDTQNILEKNKADSDSFNSQIEELKGKLNSYELKSLKTDIALKNGIPYELASRLVGETEDDLLNDAKNLSSMLTKNEPVQPLKSVETEMNKEDSAYAKLINNLDLQGE